MTWWVAMFAFAAGACLLWAARARLRRLVPLKEAARGSSIEELGAGRFRVVGRVVGIQTTPSIIDRTPCVYVESAEYRTMGSELVPLLREVGHRLRTHPFFIDDGTGRVWVDPSISIIDTVTLYEDEGLLVERRLREGEEVELVASFEPRELQGHLGPYRASTRHWQAVSDAGAPPQISLRSTMLPNLVLDDTVTLLRGSGALLLLLSLVGFAAGALF